MSGLFETIGWLLLGLLAVAVLVAWYEHLRDRAFPPSPLPATPRGPVQVDLDLDHLPDAGPGGGDQARRHAALGQIGRSTGRGSGWPETRPMIAPGGAQPQPETERG